MEGEQFAVRNDPRVSGATGAIVVVMVVVRVASIVLVLVFLTVVAVSVRTAVAIAAFLVVLVVVFLSMPVAGARRGVRDEVLPGGEKFVVTLLVSAGRLVAPSRVGGEDEPGGYCNQQEDVRDLAHLVIIGAACRRHKGIWSPERPAREVKPGNKFRDRTPFSLVAGQVGPRGTSIIRPRR